MKPMAHLRTWIGCLVIGLLFLLAACSTDPRTAALQKAVNLMEGIVQSRELVEAVKNADPQNRPSTAARGALSGGIVANFPQPPDGIAVLDGEKATQPWCVILVGDDAGGVVRIEGYGDDLAKPLIVDTIPFPPK